MSLKNTFHGQDLDYILALGTHLKDHGVKDITGAFITATNHILNQYEDKNRNVADSDAQGKYARRTADKAGAKREVTQTLSRHRGISIDQLQNQMGAKMSKLSKECSKEISKTEKEIEEGKIIDKNNELPTLKKSNNGLGKAGEFVKTKDRQKLREEAAKRTYEHDIEHNRECGIGPSKFSKAVQGVSDGLAALVLPDGWIKENEKNKEQTKKLNPKVREKANKIKESLAGHQTHSSPAVERQRQNILGKNKKGFSISDMNRISQRKGSF